jgi:hypothetical protein
MASAKASRIDRFGSTQSRPTKGQWRDSHLVGRDSVEPFAATLIVANGDQAALFFGGEGDEPSFAEPTTWSNRLLRREGTNDFFEARIAA